MIEKKHRRILKYQALRDAGFNAKDATRFKDLSWRKIQYLAQEKMRMDATIENMRYDLEHSVKEVK